MRRLLTTSTLLASVLAAGSLAAQQTYPPQQPYPGQPAPAQAYPPPPGGAQPYPGQPAPQPYPPPAQPYGAQPYPAAQPYGAQPYPAAQPMAPPPAPYGAPAPAPQGALLGAQGQIILSADRLFGLSVWSLKVEGDNGTSATTSGTAVNLLWGSDSDVSGPYATPRLGFDFAVAQSITIGGSIGFLSRSGTRESEGGGTTVSQDEPSKSGFAFAPRFGYILGINPTISIWFRGGITYFSSKTESKETAGGSTQTTTVTVDGFALNLEPQLVITPAPHFGLTLGPVGDIPLSGNAKVENSGFANSSQERSTKITNFGLTFGLLGYI
jgi:hypothetical protein